MFGASTGGAGRASEGAGTAGFGRGSAFGITTGFGDRGTRRRGRDRARRTRRDLGIAESGARREPERSRPCGRPGRRARRSRRTAASAGPSKKAAAGIDPEREASANPNALWAMRS